MSLPIYMTSLFISSTNTLEISCNKKTESKLVDCEISTIPLLGIFPPTTETYTGIKRVEYLTETGTRENSDGNKYKFTLHYVIFYQTSEVKKVRFDYRAQWVANQIDQFLNSSQKTLTVNQPKSIDIAEIANIILIILASITFFPLGLLFIAVTLNYYSVDINGNLRQITNSGFIPLHITNSGFIPLHIYRKTFSFSDIKGLALIESWDKGDKRYSIEIHTTKNEKIYLWSTYNENEANNLVDEIRRITGFYVIEQRLPPTQDS
jgi:hypothetical protein